MNVREKVQAILVATPGVTAIVAAARIKMPGPWQNLPRPYIEHFPVAATPTYTHESLIDLREWLYQVSCFGNSVSDATAVAVAVRNALGNYKGADGTVIFWRTEREGGFAADVGVEQIIQEYEVWESLS